MWDVFRDRAHAPFFVTTSRTGDSRTSPPSTRRLCLGVRDTGVARRTGTARLPLTTCHTHRTLPLPRYKLLTRDKNRLSSCPPRHDDSDPSATLPDEGPGDGGDGRRSEVHVPTPAAHWKCLVEDPRSGHWWAPI